MLHKVFFYIIFYILYVLFKFYFLVVVFFFLFVPYLIVSFLIDPFTNSHRVFGFAFSLNVVVSVILSLCLPDIHYLVLNYYLTLNTLGLYQCSLSLYLI